MAIEIVDFPIKNGGSFHCYVTVHQRVLKSMDFWDLPIFGKPQEPPAAEPAESASAPEGEGGESWLVLLEQQKNMSVSENRLNPYTQWLMISIPSKWLFHWGYTPFSDKPIYLVGA